MAVSALLMVLLMAPPAPAPAPAHIYGEYAVDQSLDLRLDDDAVEVLVTTDRAEFPGAFARAAADADGDGTLSDSELQPWRRAALAFASAHTQLRLDGRVVPLRPGGPVELDGYGSWLVGPKPARERVRLRAALPPDWRGELTLSTSFRPEQLGLTRIYVEGSTWPIASRDDARYAGEDRAGLTAASLARQAPPWLVPEQQYALHLRCTPSLVATSASASASALSVTPATTPYATPANQLGERLFAPGSAVALWFGLLLAFAYGCGHALTPGHGKALVAAYLLGRRGTWRDAVWAGLAATLAHTAVVFALGLLAALVLGSTRQLALLTHALDGLAAFGILAVGLWLLHRALVAWRFPQFARHHHAPALPQLRLAAVTVAPRPFTLRSTVPAPLVPLPPTAAHHHHHGSGLVGVLAGIAPCPTGLVIILFAVHQGRPWLGLLYATVFSAGMGMVLVAVALAVRVGYAALPVDHPTIRRVQRVLPVLSAAVVSLLGLLLLLQASRSW